VAVQQQDGLCAKPAAEAAAADLNKEGIERHEELKKEIVHDFLKKSHHKGHNGHKGIY
jgi:hypothetical protein